ncbi:MAG: hypothetical protein GOU99_04025 [Candidatus Altiarchaeota archaeon]|nr:hypothetical protein [Candidatus Altiarchaeota archaeon]
MITRELKYYSPKKIRSTLRSAKAKLIDRRTETDTCFSHYLKLKKTNGELFLVNATPMKAWFSYEVSKISEKQREFLFSQLSVMCKLDKKVVEYELDNHTIQLQDIEDLGEFVLIQGLKPERVARLLGLSGAINRTFAELKTRKTPQKA